MTVGRDQSVLTEETLRIQCCQWPQLLILQPLVSPPSKYSGHVLIENGLGGGLCSQLKLPCGKPQEASIFLTTKKNIVKCFYTWYNSTVSVKFYGFMLCQYVDIGIVG